MTRCSTTARADEEFDVAVATRDRGREYLDAGASERGDEACDVVADFLVHHRIAMDAALGMLSRRLELRLYQCQQMHRRCRERQRHRQHGFQGNETDVDDDDVRPPRQALAFAVA